ncbi:MAG: hypothetical protein KDK36_11060, partial [Leptospiraceae bacterium]|nr:hypothetical protein [Leptospiraceae bacterium]
MKSLIIILIITLNLSFCKKEAKESEKKQTISEKSKDIKDNSIPELKGVNYVDYQVGDTLVVLANGGLKLRKEPSEKSETIKVIPDNTEVIVDEIKPEHVIASNLWGNWIKTSYENNDGWLFDAFLIEKKRITNKIDSDGDCKSIDFSNEKDIHYLKVNTPLGLGVKDMDFSKILFCPSGKARVTIGEIGTMNVIDGDWYLENNKINFVINDYGEDVPENKLCFPHEEECLSKIQTVKEKKYSKNYYSYKISGIIASGEGNTILSLQGKEINPVAGKAKI